jgi:tetratricopeptide (TPR) repeat protein
MSIIHQALKKIEGERTNGGLTYISSTNERKKRINPYLLVILILLTFFFIFMITVFYLNKSEMGDTNILSQPGNAAIHAEDINLSSHNGATAGLPETDKVAEARKHNMAGIELYNSGKLEKAIEEFKTAVRLMPSYTEAYNNMGLAFMDIGNIDSAKVFFEIALQLRPEYPESLNNYGALLNDEGMNIEAIEYLKRAIEFAPMSPDPHLNIAISFEKIGRLNDAISYYEGFLRLTDKDNYATRDDVMNKVAVLKELYLAKVGN